MSSNVTVVTVTYGNRWPLLQKCLDAAVGEGVSEIIVVDNGTTYGLERLLSNRYGSNVSVMRLGTNMGSAYGFFVGISNARTRPAECIWLLDDDNVARPGVLEKLSSSLVLLETTASFGAVFGTRGGHGAHHIDKYIRQENVRIRDTAFEFHILDVPKKITKRLFPLPLDPAGRSIPNLIRVDSAPYGSLFFKKSLIDIIGLPDKNFVLYQDDTEFTRRIHKSGGSLCLAPVADVIDAENSWSNEIKGNSTALAFVLGNSDFRIYYTFRNRAYIDLKEGRRRPIFWINLLTFLSILTGIALYKRRFGRIRLLALAWRDAWTGKLGVAERFPLP